MAGHELEFMVSTLNQTARRLFAPIASDYERWARILSIGQDGKWRRVMVDGLGLPAGSRVLDVAAGTGSISRLLWTRGHFVTPVDLSLEMLRRHPGANRIQARAEALPFGDAGFDAITFGYLLRYVDDPLACLAELKRVLRPGGTVGMVEFGMPAGIWRLGWQFYSGLILPTAGRLINPGWHAVGRFLRGSIEEFHDRYPDLEATWKEVGFVEVRLRRLSLGSGLALWAKRP